MKRPLVLAALVLLTAGCSTRSTGSSEMAGMAPMLSVERFLQAANSRDLEAMARIFGTAGGPVAETGGTFGCAFKKLGDWIGLGQRCRTSSEVELRMDAIAQILEHDDYEIVGEERVAGREHRTTRIRVTLTQGETVIPEVPFVVVQTPGGRWLIEEIGLEVITEA